MRHNYAKYTIETFKVDGIIVAYQMESMAWVKMLQYA
jgi:hypothetical protein